MIILTKPESPVLFLENNYLLCYRQGSVYYYDINISKSVKKVSLFSNFKEKIMYRVPLLRRLLRFGIRTSIQINNETVLLFVNKKIYEFNIITNKLSNGFG